MELNERIASLDLSAVQMRLEHVTHGKAWSPERASLAVLGYRRFLQMILDGHTSLVPSRDIDDAWHQHILDTRPGLKATLCKDVYGDDLLAWTKTFLIGCEGRVDALAFLETLPGPVQTKVCDALLNALEAGDDLNQGIGLNTLLLSQIIRACLKDERFFKHIARGGAITPFW